MNEYQTKTIELYDTVRFQKDSFITVLKTRTIWTNNVQKKDEVKVGVGIDSVSKQSHSDSKLSKFDKSTVDKKDKTSFPWFPIIVVIIGVVICVLLYKWALK